MKIKAKYDTMVSTRGIKTKFQEGEIVLCYEPDPNKAKVLYEARVLDLVNSSDGKGKGKRAVEYLIHFQGWNSSWDRCVKEEFILKDTEESRLLQKELYEVANIHAKKEKSSRRKRRLSDLIQEVSGSETGSNKGKGDSESEPESEEPVPPIKLEPIPDTLMKVLEKDQSNVMSGRLVKVPANPHCVDALELYLRHYAKSQLDPPDHIDDMDSRVASIILCQELVDGIKTFLDTLLGRILLYETENKQFENTRNITKLKERKEVKWNSPPSKQENGQVSPRTLRRLRKDTAATPEVVPEKRRKLRSHDNAANVDVKEESPTSKQSVDPSSPVEATISNGCPTGDSCKCKEIWSEVSRWKMVIKSESQTPVPSLLYPPIFILRLFAQFEELLPKMDVNPSKLPFLISHLNSFLAYLESNRAELFPETQYLDSSI